MEYLLFIVVTTVFLALWIYLSERSPKQAWQIMDGAEGASSPGTSGQGLLFLLGAVVIGIIILSILGFWTRWG